ncbi:MAG: hypothetical protein SVU32_06520, partial [Candidatus Nanohaloarchaea archaeon]|nr:hypothetical protein [Candidatus Nanohaloarchaea archaeon]
QWFVPLTTGTYYDIETRLDMIQDERFLNVFNPNFAFDIAENILVRITLTFEDIDIVNSLHLGSGIHNLIITNVGTNNDGETQIRVNKTINAS